MHKIQIYTFNPCGTLASTINSFNESYWSYVGYILDAKILNNNLIRTQTEERLNTRHFIRELDNERTEKLNEEL